jgi:protein-tyrosine phosphatase
MRPDPDALGDLHSHLVPAVDDGARTMKEALDAVERMTRVGIRRVITTPHLDASTLQDPEKAEERIKEVQASFRALVVAVREHFPEVVLWRGFEIALDVPDPDFSDPRVRMAGTRFVLVEWPRLSVPPGSPVVIRRIREAGWIPVVAHPERYHGLGPELQMPQHWKEAGGYLQVNHGSILGQYGDEPRNRALRLLEMGAASYLATDHHPRPRHGLSVKFVREFFKEVDAEHTFFALTRTNPQRLMDDQEPVDVPRITVRGGLLSRLGSFLGGKGGG